MHFPKEEKNPNITMIADKHVGLCMYVCVCEKDQGANDGN